MPEYYTFSSLNKTYFELPAKKVHFKYGEKLSDYVLEKDKDQKTHYDPQFNDPEGLYTYGENEVETEGRLLNLKEGDIIFFYCSLVPYSEPVYRLRQNGHENQFLDYPKGKKEKYVIGFFTVAAINDVEVKLRFAVVKASARAGPKLSRVNIKENQHFEETIGNKKFRIVQGDPNRSAMLQKAVCLTSGWEKKLFKLNNLGKSIVQPDPAKAKRYGYDVLRGLRNLMERKKRILVKAIIDENPKLRNKLSEHLRTNP
jgi:hypothetical protein